MKLLVTTQSVDRNDAALGFFHAWLELLSRHYERVEVICLRAGSYDLPHNVHVSPLTQKGETKNRLVRAFRFYRFAWQLRDRYDVVFVHMNPEYLVLGGWLWSVLHKPVGFWYVHRSVNLKLRIAEAFASVIFTASPESFRLRSKKLRYVGQAVDVELFARPQAVSIDRAEGTGVRLMSVGRLSRIKNLTVIIEAVKLVREAGVDASLECVGSSVTEDDRVYVAELKEKIQNLGLQTFITFTGNVPHNDLPSHYWSASATVNASPTGGMDKTVLESLAAGTPVFVANKAFAQLLEGYEKDFMFATGDATMLAETVVAYVAHTGRADIEHALTERVRINHSLPTLVNKIVETLNKA